MLFLLAYGKFEKYIEISVIKPAPTPYRIWVEESGGLGTPYEEK